MSDGIVQSSSGCEHHGACGKSSGQDLVKHRYCGSWTLKKPSSIKAPCTLRVPSRSFTHCSPWFCRAYNGSIVEHFRVMYSKPINCLCPERILVVAVHSFDLRHSHGIDPPIPMIQYATLFCSCSVDRRICLWPQHIVHRYIILSNSHFALLVLWATPVFQHIAQAARNKKCLHGNAKYMSVV